MRRPSADTRARLPSAGTATVSTEFGEVTSGPGEQRVRVARDQQQRLDVGPDDRAAGGEGVGGGAGGRGAEDAVAAEAGQRPAVDGEDDVEHPRALGLLDRHLVEGPGAADDRAVGVEDVDLQGQPLLDRVLAALDRGQRLLDRLGLGLGEEADPAEVDAHERGVGVAGQLGGAQERAVTAEDHHDLGVAGGLRRRRARPRRRRSRGPAPRRRAAGRRCRRRSAGRPSVRASSTMSRRPVCTASRTRRGCLRAPALVPSVTAAPPPLLDGPGPPAAARRRGAATGRTPRCQPGRAADWPPPRRSPSRGTPRPAPTSRTAWTRCSGSRTTPPAPSRSRPTSNCGLTIGSRSASAPRAGGERGQHQPQRDEGQVGDDEVDRAVDRLGRQRADVGALVDPDAVVGAQAPGELAVADVDGDDLGGAPAEQHLGEAAGGGAGVERPPALDGDRERVEGAQQLVRAAGDPAGLVGIGADDDRGAGLDAGGRLGGGRARRRRPGPRR